MSNADRIANLSPEQLAKLTQRLQHRQGRSRIQPQPRTGNAFPLSFAQQRLWFLHQLHPEIPLYNVPAAVDLKGRLQMSGLQQSLTALCQRHEGLRTIFTVSEFGEPMQVIQPAASWDLPMIDLQSLPPSEQEAAVQQLATEEAQRPFDLAQGPLLRTTLLKLNAETHVLLLNVHHIVADGWSLGIFVRELALLYEAVQDGKSSPLPDLPIQYADFAMWQRQWLQKDLDQHLSYGKQQLAEAPAVLPLPCDRPRPPVQNFQGAVQAVHLSRSLIQPLRSLGQQHGATLFMTLLAAFKTLLYRYTDQADILIGAPVANRNRAETEALMGVLVNPLVLRTNLEGDPTFLELLQRVRSVVLEASHHQDLPFEKLVEAVQPERSLSHAPLLQVMFTLQTAPIAAQMCGGLLLKPRPLHTGTTQFDWVMNLLETAEGVEGWIEYRTDIFDAATMRRMVDHFQTLLTGIAANPHRQLSQLPILTEPERHQLLETWTQTQTDYPQTVCLHHWVEMQAQQRPNAIAALWNEQPLSYGELNDRANQLAHFLQSWGVGPDQLVGICLERSLEVLIAILAVLKAGGAYLPLDPDYPFDRLAFMLSDAPVVGLVTQSHLRSRLPSYLGSIVCLDADWSAIADYPTRNPASSVTPDHLAYVIYTSGSTGQPKGVLLTHRGLANLSQAQQQTFRLSSDSRILQFASFNFDASVWELVMAWRSGATLYLGRADQRLPGSPLQQFLQTHAITHATLPPSALAALSPSHLPALHTLIVAGEACPSALVSTWAVGRQFFNAYGPTETTVCATVAECTATNANPSIGRAIANTQTYVLDRHRQPVPIGVIGELYLGSVGLARGYLGRSDLTAQAFLPNPFSSVVGARLYKTGDLVRYRADGRLEFVGRADQQVKWRGFRIELGEVEAALQKHPAVQEAVVILRQDPAQLVAYVVPEPDANLTSSSLRRDLLQQLPDYLVPSVCVLLEALPLNPNGKVDRRALPAPAATPAESSSVPPRTATEAALVEIWAQVLGRESIGIHDNFFELGGHSLLVAQVIARVQDTLRVEVPLRRLFELPTIAEFAESLEAEQAIVQSFQPIQPIPRSGALPLSFAQQRIWFLQQLEPNNPVYNIPTVLHLSGSLNLSALEQSFNALLQRHEVLRTSIATVDGQPQAVIHPPFSFNLSVVDLQALPANQQQIETQRLAAEAAQHAFDLSQAPLLRVTIGQLQQTEHLLFVTLHHLIGDVWSAQILVQELAVLYNAFCHSRPAPLPELPIQYVDFADWQRRWLQEDVLQTQLTYWRQQLHNPPTLLPLPLDRPRPAVQSFRGKTQWMQLQPPLKQALQQLGQQHGATLFMTLLAAFATLLSRYTQQTDILIGTPIANRHHPGLADLIGCFLNTLVLRTDLSGNPQFSQVLAQVRGTALKAYAHQDVPFEQVIEALNLERQTSHTPLVQVMLSVHPAIAPLETSGLTLTPQASVTNTAKFDLTLVFSDSEEGLLGALEYNTDLFDDCTIARLLEHFQTLLAGIAADPAQHLADLPLLTSAERHTLLVEWNQTATEIPNLCLHEWVEAQVQQTPEAIALCFQDSSLTYDTLNQRANHLAHHLQQVGVTSETRVGLFLERSPNLLIALLAVLKAGGTYVPLDPAYPVDRLTFILADAQVAVLLSDTALKTPFPFAGRVLPLDQVWSDGSSRSPLPCPILPDALAYILYTSGSTGKPKGVQIPHRAVVNFLYSMQQDLNLRPGDVLLSVTSLSFDIAVLELLLPLIVGATVELVERSITGDGQRLAEILTQTQATFMQATPATWRLLLAAGWSGSPTLTLLCGGEALTPDLAAQLLPRGAALWNLYGPTETTIWSTRHHLRHPNDAAVIGQPIANTQLYILDEQQHPVPIGVVGELYIGGAGLAHGYVGRADLTAERFVPDKFSAVPGARLYRTGDRVKYRADGNVEYVGRMDYQVKLRGFRIELGEIEAVLAQHPLVSQAVVLIAGEAHPHLLAFVVLNDPAIAAACLREFLKAKLPEYMVPSEFRVLESFPLTPNRKIDRQALAALASVQSQATEIVVAPRDPIESAIAEIWKQVLGVESVGMDANFFEHGGHSLIATQVISRIRESFQVELPLRCLFEAPTIAALAEEVRSQMQATPTYPVPLIEPVLQRDNLPLSFAQERLWFLDQLQPGDFAYNMPIALRLSGSLNVAILEQSLNTIVQRHEILRTTFTIVNGNPVQVIASTQTVKVPIVDLSSLEPTQRNLELQQLMTEAARLPFDLAQGSLMRSTLLRLSESEHVALLTLHHIVSDGWSLGVLVQELTACYNALLAGNPSLLPALPIQYADFAVWQRQWLQGEEMQRQMSYWQRKLAGLPQLKLPIDPPQSTPAAPGAIATFTFPPSLSVALKNLSRQAGATLFMTLLAAFQTLLHRYSGAEDIVVGTDVANRNHAGVEPLIGFFVNLLVIRSDLSGNPSFRNLLQQVRTVTLEAYAHQDLPFSRLVDALRLDRRSHTPLFQVLFVLQNAPMPPIELAGLTATPLVVETGAAKFDLALFMEDTDQGTVGTWNYRTDLFRPDTIATLSRQFETLLNSIVAQPDTPVGDLNLYTDAEKAQKAIAQQQRKLENLKKFKQIAPKAISLPQGELIKTRVLQSHCPMPLVAEPAIESLDVADWARENRVWIETQLLQHGGILFRGFQVPSAQAFEQVAQAICPELFEEYGDLPRAGISGKVYGSTPYPADKAILFHNESSHLHRYPMKIWFYCVQPAEQGGETPIVDCRQMYQHLSPAVRDRLLEKQLMYVRNYTKGLDVSWQDFFRTRDRTVVETYCRQAGIEFEWLNHDGLRTRQIRPAIVQHPKTQEWVFFNQLQLHHLSFLDLSVQASLLDLFGAETLPRQVYYGDGSDIEASVLTEIQELYQQLKQQFTWQSGDILMLDNLLVAHGRNPYVGFRKIVVAMGEMSLDRLPSASQT
ncbi:non-ribosomal peptide synthetase [Myxacorys almedinensis]|uniref:Amino acid adenylation domain-containing protein n=1 Tax=Myxacorys almedinensis A TaxID=2690445 RepID=A0A8J7Z5Q4_9CYAN|nr:non-ribosomal peptide synthetase [Myxacorys almedinensis]NDJ18578.1 amino acid adenylation domain-containing protein [Myxacorys almedinensis A]